MFKTEDYDDFFDPEDYDDFFEPEEQYGENFRDRERVGGGIDHPLLMNTKLANVSGGYSNLQKIQERFFKINASEEEKFAHVLLAVFYQYRDELELRDDAMIDMLDGILSISRIQYKNPVCYLFGYYIVTEYRDEYHIDKNKLKKVNELIKNQEIETTDIIRYCRLWINKYEEQ